MPNLPKSPSGAQQVVIASDVWDTLVDQIERFANFTVDAPLEMIDSGAGRALSVDIPAGPRWVLLVQNGGVAGSDSTDCTFTYDLYDMNDTGHVTKLNTDGVVDPTGPIPDPKVTYTAGNEGIAQQDSSGAWHLFVLNEAASTEDCATPP